jgi:hypothetical protein
MSPRLPQFTASRAVLIGTARYDNTALSDLPAVEYNVIDLHAVLTDEVVSGFPPAAVEVVHNPRDAREVMDPVLRASIAATDLLLVYFAGHGLLMGETADLHLATAGTIPEQPWTGLPFQHLARVIRRSPAEVKILLLDCCYSGRAARDLMGDPVHLAVDQVSVDGVYVMTSTSGTRAGKAPLEHRHTAFTGGLLDVMRGGCTSAEDLLGMSTLYDAVRQRMTRHGWPVPEQYHKNNAGNLALVRNAVRRRPVPAPSGTATADLAAMQAPQVARVVSKLAPAARGALLVELAEANSPLAADAVRLMAATPLVNAVHTATPEMAEGLRHLVHRAREDGAALLSSFRVRPAQPALARRLLSRELRRLRERQQASLDKVTTTLHWSKSKLMRVESGAVTVTTAEARSLLACYDVPHTDPVSDYVLALAEENTRRPWWWAYRQVLWPELTTLVSLESAAAQISILALQVVPAIFQTEEYMRSVLTTFPRQGYDDETQVTVRLHRQAVLFDRDDQVDLTVILHENALHREVGRRRTAREQLDRLAEVAERPNVRLHVLPSSSRHTPATADLMVLHFDLGTGDGLVYTEAVYRDAVVDRPGQVQLHTELFTQLLGSTLDVEHSVALVRQARDSLV